MREPSDDYLSAFNCLLCYYALGDRDRMRNGFLRMLQMKLPVGDEDRYLNLQDDPQVRKRQEEGMDRKSGAFGVVSSSSSVVAQLQVFLDAVKDDKLRRQENHGKHQAEKCILLAAKLISPGRLGQMLGGLRYFRRLS